jgi:hypothetical protein
MMSKSGIRARVASAKLAERRSGQRFHAPDGEAPCQVVSVLGGHVSQVALHRVSASGVSLLIGQRLNPDTLLVVELRNPNGSYSCTVLAWVVHISPDRNGGWLAGCTFTHELAADELQRLLS